MKEKNGKEKAEEEAEMNKQLVDMMKGFNDHVIPPFSAISTFLHEKQTGVDSSKCMHESVQTERERRGKMVQNFNVLNTMIPDSFPKATRERIVVGTIHYINILEEEIKRLEELKKNNDIMMAETRTSSTVLRLSCPSVCISVSGNVALFGIELKAEGSSVPKIFMVFEKHKADVLAANVAMNHGYLKVTVTAQVIGDGEETIEKIKGDIQDIV